MFGKKGFTLVELLMVVIIIGILVTLAIPNYYRTIERAKGGKAKAALDAVRKSQISYRAVNDTFTATLSDLTVFDLPSDLSDAADSDWTYTVASTNATIDFTCTANRSGGPYSGSTVTMDQDGIYSSSVPEWE